MKRLSVALLATVLPCALAGAQEQQSFRFASYNAFLNRFAEGDLLADLQSGKDPQIQAVAEVIQRERPDVMLLNEFDYDASGASISAFQRLYLGVSQNGAAPIRYPYVYVAESNTGLPSGFDLNNDGLTVTDPSEFGYADDCYGFGFFPGQFGQVLVSRFPIDYDNVRTFQTFRWVDMPGALLPDNLDTKEPDDWYSPEELEVVRLSSKSHWDVPVKIGNQTVHMLCAHPTPPVFDGPEDRNGRRNNDEIRFWADYVTPGQGGYIYDDNGVFGGLGAGERFVIVGDYNADSKDGDSVPGAIDQLLQNSWVIDPCNGSLGGLEAGLTQGGANTGHVNSPAFDTADFTDASKFFTPSGNLRVDYVLPSSNFGVKDAGVFWPAIDDALSYLIGDGITVVSSDHRLVWTDLTPMPLNQGVQLTSNASLEFLGEATLPTGFLFDETEVGGLSAIVYDEALDLYFSLSDDRGSINPSRYYTLDIDLSDGFLSEGDITFRDVVTLLQSNGDAFEVNDLDPEGLALTKTGSLYISSEGDASVGIDPFVNQFGVAGTDIAALPVPSKYLVNEKSGIRTNLAFESLTLTPGDGELYTATENALIQDGPTASLTEGSPCRILAYDLGTGEAGAEYIYWTDPIVSPTEPKGEFATNGLVELLSVGNGFFVAVERSFSVGVGNSIRLYLISLDGADNVSGVESLEGIVNSFVPVSKQLLLDLDDLGLVLDNVEGITFGPKLADGRDTLILCSDNNFNPTQFTQFLAFAVNNGVAAQ